MSATSIAIPAQAAPVLIATGLSRRYGRRQAVRSVDLALQPGSVLGLVGANGAGKSTLLALLAGHVRPSAGSVQMAAGIARRGCIGMLPQGARPPADDTPLGFLTFAARLQRLDEPAAAARDALAAVGLSTLEQRRFRTLSEGQRRLAIIAQAFLGWPPVVLLDEPTSALDPWGRRRLRALVRERRDAGVSILIASHNLAEVDRLCDDLAIIAEGRIVARGPIGSLMPTGLVLRFDVSRGPVSAAELGAVSGVDSVDVGVEGRSFLVAVRDRAAVDPVIAGVLEVLARQGTEVRRIVRGPELEQVLTDFVVSSQSPPAVPNQDQRGAEER